MEYIKFYIWIESGFAARRQNLIIFRQKVQFFFGLKNESTGSCFPLVVSYEMNRNSFLFPVREPHMDLDS